MCMPCVQAIARFRSTAQPSAWHLSRELVADRLLELVEEPDSLQQGAIGLCGPASFLRAWLQNDHFAVVRFAITLYDTGRSSIGTWQVAACAELLACPHATIDWGKRTPCPGAEWMMMGALQDEQNTFRPDFNGQPENDWRVGMIPGDVVAMLAATGLYTQVENRTAALPINVFDDNSTDDALLLVPDERTDVILLVNAGLIDSRLISHGAGAFWDNNVSNHYIGLLRQPQVIATGDGDAVRLSFFSWGALYLDQDFPRDQFDNNYYGSIVAHARQPKGALASTTPAVPARPVGLHAAITDERICLHWCGGSVNETRYGVQRWRASVGLWEDCPQRGAARPSTAPVVWSDDVDIRTSDTLWYRVMAYNRLGASDWTAPVMVSLPSGQSRTVDPLRDADVYRPPCYVERVSVLRAPRGLVPIGHGTFAPSAHECETPQWVYDARWEGTTPSQRALRQPFNRAFRSDRDAYFFIRFADFGGPVAAAMDDNSVTLILGGVVVDHPVQINVPLQPLADRSGYWGHFALERLAAGYTLTLGIRGKDTATRYLHRQPDGREIDATPGSRARPRLDAPPLFGFIDYTAGIDVNHKLLVAALPATLAADAAEPNDHPSTATPLTLAPAAGQAGASIDVVALTLGRAYDEDHFIVSYAPSPADNACGLLQPTTQVLSECLGLSVVHYPPVLTIAVYTDDPVCVDLTLNRAGGQPRTHDLRRTHQITIYNPTQAYFDDSRFELVVRNSAPEQQGPIPYRLHLRFQHLLDEPHVDGKAPAYRPLTTKARQLLHRLYTKLDLPRPGEDYRTRIPRDTRVTVQRAAAFMLDRQNQAAMHASLGARPSAAMASDFRRLAVAAQEFGLSGEAEHLLQAASGKLGMAHDRAGQLTALTELKAHYEAAGMVKQAENVAAHMQALEAAR